jgi:hypothetical protein
MIGQVVSPRFAYEANNKDRAQFTPARLPGIPDAQTRGAPRYGLHFRRIANPLQRKPRHFVASAAASIATGRSEPVPGRELHPLKSSAFHGVLFRQLSDYSPISSRDFCILKMLEFLQKAFRSLREE